MIGLLAVSRQCYSRGITPIMENQKEKKMENEMEAENILGIMITRCGCKGI